MPIEIEFEFCKTAPWGIFLFQKAQTYSARLAFGFVCAPNSFLKEKRSPKGPQSILKLNLVWDFKNKFGCFGFWGTFEGVGIR
jgi:hypothetical protein